MELTPAITAAAGFLIAVLWFDLMFDVQTLRHRRAAVLPEGVLASIAAYYHRVTTTASPMGRLVALVMLVLLAGLIAQAVRGDAPVWASAACLGLTAVAIGLTAARVLRAAQRLGERTDAIERQSQLARGILRDHLFCLGCMVTVLVVQLSAG